MSHSSSALTVLGSPELSLERTNHRVKKCKDRLSTLSQVTGNEDERFRDAVEVARVGLHCASAAIERALHNMQPEENGECGRTRMGCVLW